MLTHNARRADELVDEVDLQVVDVQALRVIPLVAPVQVGYICILDVMMRQHIPVAGNHDLVLVVACLAYTI